MIKTVVELAHMYDISTIKLGKLKGIRKNNRFNKKANSMIHNFWSFSYIIKRIKEKAEEYGIRVKEVSEYKTSSTCPRCKSNRVIRKGRLFKCLSCGLEAHRDVVGVLNMATLRKGGLAIGVMAHPLLLRWNGMKWEPKRAMNTKPMKTLEARIPLLK